MILMWPQLLQRQPRGRRGVHPVTTVMEHIADANEFHVWKAFTSRFHFPFMHRGMDGRPALSSMFEHGHNGGRRVCAQPRAGEIALPTLPSRKEVHIDGVLHRKETVEGRKERREGRILCLLRREL